MSRSNANRNFSSDESTWCFLVEFSLLEFLADHDRKDPFTVGFILQAVRGLGMSLEWAKNIEMTLAESATEALAHSKQGAFLIPWRIRVFCQKKVIGGSNSVLETGQSHQEEQAIEHARMAPNSGIDPNGGWGYFLIEHGEDSLPEGSANPPNCIDLYLYKEGK